MLDFRGLLGVALCSLLAACSAAPPNGSNEAHAIASQAPHLGAAGGSDSADRACGVVLREVGRATASDGSGYAQQCSNGVCNWVFDGHVDVSRDAYPSDANVGVLYHLASDATWWEVPASSLPDSRAGFFTHEFKISEHLVGPDTSDADLANARIELIPFVRLPDGSRVFDHNREKGDFDVYSFGQTEGFRIFADQSCQPVVGAINFQGNWQENAYGSLHDGGWLAINYSLDRLPACRGTHDGYPAWDTLAYVRFSPGGQLTSASVRELVTDQGRPTNTANSRQAQLKIPADATSVDIWFENYSGAGNFCDTWDSNYGKNYHFDILPSVDDPRCQNVESWPQNAHVGTPTCTMYTPTQQVDADTCELYVQSFGHAYEAHYGIPFEWLDATVHVGPQDGQVVNAGMYTRYVDSATGETHERFSLGFPADASTYKTGFAYHSTAVGSMTGFFYKVQALAFFVDVRRPSGQIVRLWQSRGGQNYGWDDAFGAGTTRTSIPYGNETWANDDESVFDQKHACGG